MSDDLQGVRCLVIGNAAGRIHEPWPSDLCITFNGGQCPQSARWHLDASSKRANPGGLPEICLHGYAPSQIIDVLRIALKASTEEGLRDLRCWPSTGFSVVHALWGMEAEVCISRIHFDPSLQRNGAYGPRSAPPQAYHNWLGERRVSLARWRKARSSTWSWDLPKMATDEVSQAKDFASIGMVLEALGRAKKTRSLDELEELALRSIVADPGLLECGSRIEKIIALERYFHLIRGVNKTSNWWLYDDRGSQVVQALAEQIRKAQNQAFGALGSIRAIT